MAVTCPGCGRQYDVTLFQFGRTIDCTCGARVGLQAQRQARPPGAVPTFIADAMLGSLSRWMRMLGFDVAYEAHIPDEELVRRALQDRRVLLTRDRKLPNEWTVPDLYLVEADTTLPQLREVLEAFDLEGSVRPFTRCSLCNAKLVEPTAEQIANGVPAYVRSTTTVFRACPICGRIYWRGTHTDDMWRVLEQHVGIKRPE